MVRFGRAFDKYINIAVKFEAILLTGHHTLAIIKEVTYVEIISELSTRPIGCG